MTSYNSDPAQLELMGAYTRSARLLLFACLLIATAVWVTNTSFMNSAAEHRELLNKYYDSKRVLKRFEIYESGGVEFIKCITTGLFANIIDHVDEDYLASLTSYAMRNNDVDQHNCVLKLSSYKDQDKYMYDEAGLEDYLSEINKSVINYSAHANTLLANIAKTISLEEKLFRQLLDDATTVGLQDFVTKWEEYINNVIIKSIIKPMDSNSRNYITEWIVTGKWPHPFSISGHGGYSDLDGLRKWVDRISYEIIQEYLIDQLSSEGDIEKSKKLINSGIYEAYKELKGYEIDTEYINLFGAVNLRLIDVQNFAQVILLYFQVMFYIHWRRMFPRIDSHRDRVGRSSLFPMFASPPDPFGRSLPTEGGLFLERIVWAVFLMLPYALATLGALYSYNLGEITSRSCLESWLISIYDDGTRVLYLVAWGVYVAMLIDITTEKQSGAESPNRVSMYLMKNKYKLTLILLIMWTVITAAHLYVLGFYNDKIHHYIELPSSYFAIGILLFSWCVFMLISLSRGLIFVSGLLLVTAGLILFM